MQFNSQEILEKWRKGILPLRSPHVGALHIVLVASRPDQLGSDLIQIEERLRIGSIVFGNFGGASLTEIQTRKKLAALTAIISAPEGADAGASTAHIFAGKQLEVRSVIRLNVHLNFLQIGRWQDWERAYDFKSAFWCPASSAELCACGGTFPGWDVTL